MVRSIDEKRGLLDLLFVAELAEKQQRELCGPGLKQPDVEGFVYLVIDCGIQPVALIVDPNHRLVYSNLIWNGIAVGL